jgi:hypothetical protein
LVITRAPRSIKSFEEKEFFAAIVIEEPDAEEPFRFFFPQYSKDYASVLIAFGTISLTSHKDCCLSKLLERRSLIVSQQAPSIDSEIVSDFDNPPSELF